MDLKYFRYGCNVAKNDALIAVGKRLKKCINKPYLIYYSITYRCNAKCITCLRWKNESLSEELTLEKHKDIVSQLHRWLGVFGLSFTGGEAFVKEDFLDLVEHAYKLNISTNVATNGIVFEGEMRDKIAETGLNSIIFSLNSIEPDIHDRYKGILGLHEKIVEAIKYIKKRHPRIRVGVLCLIAKDTYKNLGDFVEWVNDLGVDTIDFQPIYGIHSDKVSFDLPVLGSHSTPLAEIDDIDELKKQINFLIQKQEDGVPIVIPKTNLETIPKYFQDIKKFKIQRNCKGCGARIIVENANRYYCDKCRGY